MSETNTPQLSDKEMEEIVERAVAPSAAPAVTRHPLAVTPLSSPDASKNNAVVTKFTKSSTSR